MNSVTNCSFSQCLDSIPDCVGIDDANHRVFVVTNEELQANTLGTLSKQDLVGNTLVGTSGFSSLNFAAVRGTTCPTTTGELENILLIDRSLRVEHFWKKMQDIITGFSHRLDVIDQIVLLIDNEKNCYFGGNPDVSASDYCSVYTSNFVVEIQSGESWLSSDEKFAKIKKIFDNGHFLFKRADFTNPQTFKSMNQIFKDEGVTVDTLYVSNIFEYMEIPEEKKAFIDSVGQLAAPKTLVVHTEARGCQVCDDLKQVIHRTNGLNIAKMFPTPPPSKKCWFITDINNAPKDFFPYMTLDHYNALASGDPIHVLKNI